MSELMDYLPVLLTAVLGLTLMTNVIVQVLKGLLYDRIPTNLLAFLTAAVVTASTGFALWSYYGFSITGWMIAGLIGLCFLAAMTNWCRWWSRLGG